MADETSSEPKIVAFRADSRALEAHVRRLAKKTENIDWSRHALERMDERGIVFDDALRVLREGFAAGTPEKTTYDEWKLKMTGTIKGARQAGAVVIILREDRLFVKTVEWEDL